ncbi:MAG: phosphohistidine phosphatase SixA [Desulfuromonas sp.]|uniref:phosphohistidine phosphatase SixA n=1 Tax=Desulfuromonas sp. TaxID=892 RepID=UPI000CC85C2E|nr:phosphohistidine phosphatase SixA [Desulfuromonas sp.]PLX82337.1 MAG: phosphohistidine phosphatase SixA [Desulfuromonas sp.]
MQLYLMQHGQALAEELDPEQPLSPEGVAQIKASARAMKRMGINLDLIVSSPKRRSHQTAALVAEAVNYPYSDIVETEAVKPLASARESLDFLMRQKDCRSVLVAGHLPCLAEIASALLAGDGKVSLGFANGGLCLLEAPSLAGADAELRYFLSPQQMSLIATG